MMIMIIIIGGKNISFFIGMASCACFVRLNALCDIMHFRVFRVIVIHRTVNLISRKAAQKLNFHIFNQRSVLFMLIHIL